MIVASNGLISVISVSLYPVIKLRQPTQRLTCCNSPVKLTSWPWSFYDSLLELHELNFCFGFRCYSTFTTATENCIQGFTICCKWLFIDRVRQSFVWFSFMSAAECHTVSVSTQSPFSPTSHSHNLQNMYCTIAAPKEHTAGMAGWPFGGTPCSDKHIDQSRVCL